ncbi:MAG: ribosome maturation factor RimM [Chloroflexota bacterium]
MEENVNLVYLARYVKPTGVDGDILLGDLAAAIPSLPVGSSLHMGYSVNFTTPYRVENWHSDGRRATVKLFGIDSPETAENFGEFGVFIERSLLERLYPDLMLTDEILELTAYDAVTGERLGSITDVWLMPANDVWTLELGEEKIPLPVIEDVIVRIDRKRKSVFVNLMEGLRELAYK